MSEKMEYPPYIGRLLALSLAVFHCLVHGEDVLHRHAGLDIMHLGKDKPAVGGENIDIAAGVRIDFMRSSERQHLLRVAAAAPEADPIAKLALQPDGIHAACADLHRVEDVASRIDNPGDQLIDTSAAVQEDGTVEL